jgi:fumarylacetoacetase
MTAPIDETHDPGRQSWVGSANGHVDFPIQNLPLGVFSAGGVRRGGAAIGDEVLDLAALAESGLLHGPGQRAAAAAAGAALNGLLTLGAGPRRDLRRQLSALLSDEAARPAVEPMLHSASDCRLHLPVRVGDYTDFYAGIHHAINVGKLFRPDTPLLANYKHLPIAYHGRASSVRVSGAPVVRPHGQSKAPDAPGPSFGPSRRLDYELELGVWIGPGNRLGEPIPIGEAADHIAGLCLLNDWSARDLQTWEYQPLGPFLAKSFLTTVSPWIITPEALAPFRVAQPPRAAGDPAPLPHLLDAADQSHGAFALDLDVAITTADMRSQGLAPHRLARVAARELYWTIAQMVAHHASNGCNLRSGDLFGSGAISGPTDAGFGSLLELSHNGDRPIELPPGETRGFLEDGDEVVLSGRFSADGFVAIGFGPCRGMVRAAEADR